MPETSLDTARRIKSNTPQLAKPQIQIPRLAFTMAETAQALGISYISVHRLLKRGLLKSSTALRHKLIARSEIERFLKE